MHYLAINAGVNQRYVNKERGRQIQTGRTGKKEEWRKKEKNRIKREKTLDKGIKMSYNIVEKVFEAGGC